MENDLELLLREEIQACYSREIEELCSTVSSGPANISVYAIEERIAEEAVRSACAKAGMQVNESASPKKGAEKEVCLFRPCARGAGSLKKMYRILERYKEEGLVVVFLITSLRTAEGFEKRVKSRMEEKKMYIGKLALSSYRQMFKKLAKKHGAAPGSAEEGKENRRKELEAEETCREAGAEDALRKIEEGYEVDSSFLGMRNLFYSTILGLGEANAYEALNGVHFVLLIASTYKKITARSAAEEFSRSVQGIKHLRGVCENIVLRRYHDLVEMGLIRAGLFVGDRMFLDEHIAQNREVYLRVLMKRAKKHWSA